MAFSSDTIRRKSRSTEEYEKGRELFCSGKVKFLSSDSFWKGEENLKTLVSDGGRTYQVSLLIKGDCIYQASCQCPAHREYKGLCCHEAAAAFYAMEKREGEASPHVSTPPQVRRMIHTYTSREMTRLIAAKMEEKIHLQPVFREHKGRLYLSLKIGVNRFYLVKDMAAFAEALECDAYVEYGKQLGFYHSTEAFDEESARLAEEIIRIVGEYQYLYEKLNPLRSGVKTALRELELSPGSCDSMMKFFAGHTAEFEMQDGSSKMLLVKKENPRLFGVIKAFGRDGARLSILDEIKVFYGKRKLYLIREDILYCCDKNCTMILREFLQSMNTSAGNDYGVLSVEMSEKDLPAFCDYVLPKISDYVSLEAMGIDLEQYHTAPLQTKFYFDSLSADEVTLKVEFWYGNEKFTPFDRGGSTVLYRDQVGEVIAGTLIKKYFPSRYADGGCFVIKDDEDAIFRLLDGGLQEFEELGELHLENGMKERKILPERRLRASVSIQDDWLNLKVDTGDLPQSELTRILSAYRQKSKYYRLKSGDFLRLSDTGFGTLAELYAGLGLDGKQSLKGEMNLPRYRSMYLDKVFKDGRHMDVSRDSGFKSIVRNMNAVNEGDFEVPAALKNTLREYQKYGYFWFRTLDAYGFGGILADDMGLGKTIQVIALLTDEACKNPAMKALIVCPASLVYNWENEIGRFSPELSVRVITGTAEEREMLLGSRQEKAQVYITSYDLLRRDTALYENMVFRFQIIDEAQYIKNHTTQNAKAVKKIRAVTKFALTGTPIENRLSDLWSIFDYLMPGFLYSYPKFKKEYEIPVMKEGSKAAMKRLHRLIGPFILRRYKKDVLKDLPDKLEHVVYSKMEKPQRELYTANALRLKSKLEKTGEDQYRKEKIQILSELTRLRQICCDPGLCYEDYKGGAAKLETCMELISGAVAANHKILLFSQFTSMLDILEKRLIKEKIAYYKLTGQTGKEERIELVSAYNHDDVPVFLISLKAGGTGLNLTAADVVIHFDPWWNLAAENQATDRAHRIGQKKVVSVFRLIAGDTIEEGILRLQQRKRELNDAVIEKEAASFGNLDRNELIKLLEEENA